MTNDFFARRLIQHTPLPGRVRLAMLGSLERLIRRGIITAHRRITADGAEIDTWVVTSTRGTAETRTDTGNNNGAGVSPRFPTTQQNMGEMPMLQKGTVLLIHGLWDSKARMLPLARKLAAAGFCAVLPDLRCHGKSTGKFTTFGFCEKFDMQAVMRNLAAEGLIRGPTYILGFSVGGAVATQFAAICPDCRGLLLLGPVAGARLIMRRMLKFVAPWKSESSCQAIIDRAGELGGFDVNAASAIEAARRITCPAVVAHGLLDHTVPPAHGKAIYDALAGPKQLVLVPRVGHNSLLWGRSDWIVSQLAAFANQKDQR